MGVDASAIGGIGLNKVIPTYFSHYKDLGLLKEDQEDEIDDYGIDDWVDFLEPIVGDCVELSYTYGYNDSELYAFVRGDTIDEIYNNVEGYIEGLSRIGVTVTREEIEMIVISFFS